MAACRKAAAINQLKEICPDCNSKVTDSDEGIKCEICSFWFHCQCQSLTYQRKSLMKERDAKNAQGQDWIIIHGKLVPRRLRKQE